MTLNDTHDPKLKSWVSSANTGQSDFPIQNLPFCVFKRRGSSEAPRGGVAIGDQIVDLAALSAGDVLSGVAAQAAHAASQNSLNAFMEMGQAAWSALRQALSAALRESSSLQTKTSACLLPQTEAEFMLPARIGDYTDFYASIHHATNVGRLFRPDNPLLPNYKWVPIAYHGRASSIRVSGQPFKRPCGQRLPPGAEQPVVGPTQRLDYELELGIFIGKGNELGHPITIEQAESHVFGLCLLNDWSARELQAWEYQPLGPFLSKNFATTISPWIVTFEALAPFRVPFDRPAGDPQPLPYLDSEINRRAGGIDIQLEASLCTARMRAHNRPPQRLSSCNFRHSYWTVAQLVAHHTVNGCNLQAGDLFGSGTQSGPGPGEAGSLLELTRGGKQRIRIDDEESRAFLEDGDEVIFRAWCEKSGHPRIGFGEAMGSVAGAFC